MDGATQAAMANPFDAVQAGLPAPTRALLESLCGQARLDRGSGYDGREPRVVFRQVRVYDLETAAWIMAECRCRGFRCPEGRLNNAADGSTWISFDLEQEKEQRK